MVVDGELSLIFAFSACESSVFACLRIGSTLTSLSHVNSGVALQTGGKTIPIFVIGRVFAGLGVGGTSCLVPMYQAECAPKSIRGGLVACYQWMITIGLLIAAVSSQFSSFSRLHSLTFFSYHQVVVNGTKDISNAACYQIPIGLQFIVRPPSHPHNSCLS